MPYAIRHDPSRQIITRHPNGAFIVRGEQEGGHYYYPTLAYALRELEDLHVAYPNQFRAARPCEVIVQLSYQNVLPPMQQYNLAQALRNSFAARGLPHIDPKNEIILSYALEKKGTFKLDEVRCRQPEAMFMLTSAEREGVMQPFSDARSMLRFYHAFSPDPGLIQFKLRLTARDHVLQDHRMYQVPAILPEDGMTIPATKLKNGHVVTWMDWQWVVCGNIKGSHANPSNHLYLSQIGSDEEEAPQATVHRHPDMLFGS